MNASTPRRPTAPPGLEKRGRRFWRAAVDEIDFDIDGLELLVDTCRTLDTIERLRAIVDAEGEMTKGSMGQPVAHPLLAELRHQRKQAADFLSKLGIDSADGQPIDGVLLHAVPDAPTYTQQQAARRAARTQRAKSAQGRKAAAARWNK